MADMDLRRLESLRRDVAASLADDVALALAAHVAETAKASLGTNTAGRTTPRGAGRTHTASAPGNPPAVDTGALRDGIRAQVAGDGEAQVTDGVAYGVHLEFGTRHMAARPFMTPAVEAMRREVETLVRGVTDEVLA